MFLNFRNKINKINIYIYIYSAETTFIFNKNHPLLIQQIIGKIIFTHHFIGFQNSDYPKK